MPTPQNLKDAKEAYDTAWKEATKYGDEALEALEMADKVMARDTADLYIRKAKRALTAYENWSKAAQLAAKVLDEYYARIRV